MEWTQQELEELYQEVNKRAAADPAFLKEFQADPAAALEKIAGRPLPEGFRLKAIEADASYNAYYYVPEFTAGELNINQLQAVYGGAGGDQSAPSSSCGADDPQSMISFFLIISACAAAVSIGPCSPDACGAACEELAESIYPSGSGSSGAGSASGSASASAPAASACAMNM